MKAVAQIVRFGVLAVVCLTIAACAEVKIASPDAKRRNVTTPFDLVVEHTGCGQPLPGIAAWLDKGTAAEQEISRAFVFDGGHKWTAFAYPLPLGTHTLDVDPDVNWGNPLACYGHKADTRRTFIVHESTCIKGRAYYRFGTSGPGVPKPHGSVQVTLADGGETVARGETDANSDFCLDGIPVGHFFDVTFWEVSGPQLAHVDAGITPHSCANQDCPDICEYTSQMCQEGCFIAEEPEL